MDFSIDKAGDVSILRLNEQRLDSSISSDLKAQLLILVDGLYKKILIDLTKVEYADSSGLGALLLGLRQARDRDIQFGIFGAQKRVQSLIRIAHLEDVLINHENEEEALNALQ